MFPPPEGLETHDSRGRGLSAPQPITKVSGRRGGVSARCGGSQAGSEHPAVLDLRAGHGDRPDVLAGSAAASAGGSGDRGGVRGPVPGQCG